MNNPIATTRLARSRIPGALVRSAALLAAAACTSAALGQVTILPATTPESSANPLAINNAGAVVGFVSEPLMPFGTLTTPAQWAGPALNLSLFAAPPGAPSGGFQISSANGLNDVGSAVGQVAWPIAGPGGDFASHAVRWNNGVPTDLGTVPGFNLAGARAINNAGEVIGFGAGATTLAVRWTPSGVLQSLELLAADHNESLAFGINNSGRAVGYSGFLDGDLTTSRRPVAWTGTTATDLTTPAGFNLGSARSINDTGDVVGSSIIFDENIFDYTDVRATQWAGGVPELLPLLDGFMFSAADHINASGLIIGNMYSDTNSAFYGFDGVPVLWQDGQVIDLRTLLAPSFAEGITFHITDLNDAGQITGTAITPTGSVGFVMTIPTPSAAAVLALGGLMAARRRRRGTC